MSRLLVVEVSDAERQRRAARMSRVGWVTGAAVLLLVVTVQPFRDTDVWWHLALGRFITAHGIPAQEPFSFLPAAYPWVGQQWLYEVTLAGLVGAGGAGLASLVMGAVAVAAVVFAAMAVPRNARVSGPWLAAAMLLSGLVMATVVGVRGQVISVLGVAIVVYVISRWREGRTGVLFALPPLFLLWANMHAGFIAGLALIVAALLLARPAGSAPMQRRYLSAALVASVLATIANPAGPGLYVYIGETFANPTLTQNITEWASPDFHDVWIRLFELEVVLLIVLWTVSGGPDRQDAVVAFAMLLATLQAQRNLSLFAVVALPQVARYGARAWTLRVAPQRRRSVPPHRRRTSPLLAGTAIAMVTAAVGVTIAPQLSLDASAAFEASRYPKAATDYVALHFAGQRLYSIDTWGGYLVYRFPEGRVVFLYDETAVFGNAALQRYLDVDLLRPDWVTVLTSLRIDHAILPAHARETSAIHELGWVVDCYDQASDSVVLSTGPVGVKGPSSGLQLPPPGAPAC